MDDKEFLEDLRKWQGDGEISGVHTNWEKYQLIRKIYDLAKEEGYLEGFKDGVINGREDARQELNSYVAPGRDYDEGFADGMNFGYNKAYNEIRSYNKEVSE